MSELAKLLQVHVRTIQAWHKAGLSPNNPNDRPLLFRGDVVQKFLCERRDKNRHQLRPGEFFCFKCHAGRRPVAATVHYVNTDRRIGKDARQVIIHGTCASCNGMMRMFTTDKALELSKAKEKVEQRERGLSSEQLGFVFTDLKAG